MYPGKLLEFVTIVFFITKLRFYLLEVKFYVEADRSPLLKVMNNKLQNNRIYKGSLLLQEYEFKFKIIFYKSVLEEKLNILADALRRDEKKGFRENRKFHEGVSIFEEDTGIFSE